VLPISSRVDHKGIGLQEGTDVKGTFRVPGPLLPLVVAGLLFCPVRSRAGGQWIESKSSHYTVA
jgi:hypothetical protein